MGDYLRLSVLDYLVFATTIAISLAIGIFFAIWDRKRDTPLNYFLAGRKSGTIPVAISFAVTFQSSIVVIGSPAEVYMYGLKYLYILVASLGAFIVGGIIFAPVFHQLGYTSVNKYLKMRYHGNSVRYLALFIGIVYNVSYMGTVTFGTSVALEVIMGVPLWVGVILYTAISTAYTSIGGIKAVIWSDVFQMIMMLGGIIALLIKAINDTGGFSDVLTFASSRMQNDFRVDPRIRYQLWNASFGAFVPFLVLTCSQSGFQRINSTASVRSAKLVYIIAFPFYSTFYFLSGFVGVSVFAYYSKTGCDPLESGRVNNENQLVPLAVLDLLLRFPGLTGLFIASLSSGALSTLSSCLTSLSAITYDDVIKEKFSNMSVKRVAMTLKIVVIVYGVIGLVVAFAVSQISGTIVAIFVGFMGCFTGPYTAIFVLSVMSRRITSKGAFIGGIVGMMITFWLIIGQKFTEWPDPGLLPPGPTDKCPSLQTDRDGTLSLTNYLTVSTANSTFSSLSPTTEASMETEHDLSPLQYIYSISYWLFALVGFVTTVIVAVFVSFFTKEANDIDERCMFSFRKHVLSKWSDTIESNAAAPEPVESEEHHELMSNTA